MSTYKLLQDLVKSLPEHNTLDYPFIDFRTLIKEFRTVGLRLPRQSGKTTAAKKLAKDTSSFLYTRSHYDGGNLFNYVQESLKVRGRRKDGLKLTHLIFDEFNEIPEAAYYFVVDLSIADMLANNFSIVHLYT